MAKVKMSDVIEATEVEDTEQDARKKERARARRAAKRGAIEGAIECQLCARGGKVYKANSLVTHLTQVHGMDATQYEEALGIPVGSGEIVAEVLRERFAASGKLGAEALARKRAAERAVGQQS